MRKALLIIGGLACTGMIVASTLMNAKFGIEQGRTDLESGVYATLSVAADMLKWCLPFLLFAALRAWHLPRAIVAGALLTLCVGYSLVAALGFAAGNRAETIGARAVEADQFAALRSDLERLRERRSWLPQHRAEAVIGVDLQILDRERVKDARGRWTDFASQRQACLPGWPAIRDACSRDLTLAKELAAAKEAAKLDAEIQARSLAVAGYRGPVAGDVQAALLAQLTGVEAQHVQIALIVLICLLVELASAFGPYVVATQFRPEPPRPTAVKPTLVHSAEPTVVAKPEPKPLTPEDVARAWRDERIVAARGEMVRGQEAFQDYQSWAVFHKVPKEMCMNHKSFGEWLVQDVQGIAEKVKSNGIMEYRGIALKKRKAA